MMNGILLIDKPQGWTSHDVVAKVRGLTRIRRVGHTGTLDPLATGVLVLCLGQATRLVEYIVGHDKMYRATIQLGVQTDTYDAEGQVLATRPVHSAEADVRRALERFQGAIQQTPPMYSALKRDGKKLVDLARQGIDVPREPRNVTIYALQVLAFDPATATLMLDVHCSSGTYIRSLAHDLGQVLGCGAHLAALRRSAVGPFDLAQATTLDAFVVAVADDTWTKLLRPMDQALMHLPSIHLSVEQVTRARHGAAIEMPEGLSSELLRAYDPQSALIGILRVDRARNQLRPEKIFVMEAQRSTKDTKKHE